MRDSWKTEPVGETVPIRYRDRFDESEFERMSAGLIPHQMEDKWFVYFEGLTAFMHRSWTGQHVYTVEFTRRSDRVVIERARVALDATQGELDAPLLRFLLRGLLLHQTVPFPIPRDVAIDEQPIFMHSLVGYQFPTARIGTGSLLTRVHQRFTRGR
jgi:hypothetical protein